MARSSQDGGNSSSLSDSGPGTIDGIFYLNFGTTAIFYNPFMRFASDSEFLDCFDDFMIFPNLNLFKPVETKLTKP